MYSGFVRACFLEKATKVLIWEDGLEPEGVNLTVYVPLENHIYELKEVKTLRRTAQLVF